MFRLLLYWLPSLVRTSVGSVAFAGIIVGLLALVAVPPASLVVVGVACFALPFYRYGIQLARFGQATWRFRTVIAGPIVLRYAPELHGRIDLEQCVKRGSEALAELSQRFGSTLRRRLVIFLFPTSTSISRIFGSPYGGFALIRGDAIGVVADLASGGTFDEVILHELAHLFSARLGGLEPPLKSEGLATWLMGSIDGKPIDFHALATLLTGRYEFLTRLAAPAGFYQVANSYLFAGSFTGDLIRRFGWGRYRDFFRLATSKNFESNFAQVFGLSLLKAEHQWRDDLLQRRQTFEPELTRFMMERDVETAYEAGHLYRCLQTINALSETNRATGKSLSYAATTHMYLGHYTEAVHALEQALQTDDPWVRAMRSASLLLLGNLYDLLGERRNAEQAYHRALAEPDFWTGPAHSTHALARRYLKREFTEQDLQATLRPTNKESRGRGSHA